MKLQRIRRTLGPKPSIPLISKMVDNLSMKFESSASIDIENWRYIFKDRNSRKDIKYSIYIASIENEAHFSFYTNSWNKLQDEYFRIIELKLEDILHGGTQT